MADEARSQSTRQATAANIGPASNSSSLQPFSPSGRIPACPSPPPFLSLLPQVLLSLETYILPPFFFFIFSFLLLPPYQLPLAPSPSLAVLMHNRMSRVLVRREHDAAVAAEVLRVLQPGDQVGDAAEAAAEAEDGGPGTAARAMRTMISMFFVFLAACCGYRVRQSRYFACLLAGWLGGKKGRRGRANGEGGETHCTVFPECFSHLVIALV